MYEIFFFECGTEYRRLSGLHLPNFGTAVMNGVFDHPLVFDPASLTLVIPSTKVEFLALINAAQNSYSLFDKGGSAQKLAFNKDTENLVALVDKYAIYVNTVAKGNAVIITTAGFTATHSVPVTKSVVPGQPLNVTIANGLVSGTLEAECETFGGYHHYGCIACEGHPLIDGLQITSSGKLIMPANITFRIFHDFTQGRKKVFNGLTKGVEYYFYYYIINAAGVGALSVVVSKMCS